MKLPKPIAIVLFVLLFGAFAGLNVIFPGNPVSQFAGQVETWLRQSIDANSVSVTQ